MRETLAGIKSLLAQNSFPLFGIAESASMEDAPQGYRPSDLLSGAKSLLAIGLPVPKGAYQCKGRSIETVWRTHSLYYKNIDAISLRVSLLLEEQGGNAVPIFGCFPFELKGLGDFLGYASLVKMAEVAGLGKTGKNGLLFNSTYGPRLMLGGVITTAELPAQTWPEKDESGCPEGCGICQEKCPVKAIAENGEVDRVACVKHSSKAPILSHLLKDKEYDLDELQKINLTTTTDDNNINTCNKCVSACPYC
jgi:epoxyqueuosine reductase QueG